MYINCFILSCYSLFSQNNVIVLIVDLALQEDRFCHAMLLQEVYRVYSLYIYYFFTLFALPLLLYYQYS
jgi:hypothetical protein